MGELKSPRIFQITGQIFFQPLNITSWGVVLSMSKKGSWMRVCLIKLQVFGFLEGFYLFSSDKLMQISVQAAGKQQNSYIREENYVR